MRASQVAVFVAVAALSCACASTEPEGAKLAPVTDNIAIEVRGDGFVVTEGRRIPR